MTKNSRTRFCRAEHRPSSSKLFVVFAWNNAAFTHLLPRYHKTYPYQVDSRLMPASVVEWFVVYEASYVAWSDRSVFIWYGIPPSSSTLRRVFVSPSLFYWSVSSCLRTLAVFVLAVRSCWLPLLVWLSSLLSERRLGFLLLLSVLIRYIVLLFFKKTKQAPTPPRLEATERYAILQRRKTLPTGFVQRSLRIRIRQRNNMWRFGDGTFKQYLVAV
jgi:hypothetical protein